LMWEITVSLAAGLVSGLLFWMCVRLRPVTVAAWLAPLPLLLLAPRVPEELAIGAAAVAWLIGQLARSRYAIRVLKRPWPMVAVEWLGGCAGIGAITAIARGYMTAGHVLLAAVALPSAWVAMEYLVALRSPHGAWWSIGYTQADRPAIIQVASLTGIWGVSALVMLPAGAVAAATAPAGSMTERLAVLVATVALVAAALGYGRLRTRRPLAGDQVHVGLAAQPDPPVPAGAPDGAALAAKYLDQVRLLASHGARLVVLPEVVFQVPGERPVDHLQPLARLAGELGVTIVVGIASCIPGRSANQALVLGGDGRLAGTYVKRHLIPRLEARYRPGRELLVLPDGHHRLGVIICKDLDFPGLARSYRRGGARLLLAPAWDFGSDGWLHSRMAVLRGVESGVAVARVARGGRATISDAHGGIAVDAVVARATSVSAMVRLTPEPTVYSRLGEWFAWCCVAITAVLVFALIAS
jgi:apolipoprotein N-acyltransferase